MVYTLIDHRNDVIKCSKLNWNTSCRRVVSLQSGATVLQEHRTLLPSPLQSRWLSWMSWAGVIVPMMVRPLLVLRCSTFLARYVFINTCRKSLVFFNILKWSSNSDGISCRTCVPICVQARRTGGSRGSNEPPLQVNLSIYLKASAWRWWNWKSLLYETE